MDIPLVWIQLLRKNITQTAYRMTFPRGQLQLLEKDMKEKDDCPHCKEGNLCLIEDPHDDHFNYLQCDKCDSTYGCG